MTASSPDLPLGMDLRRDGLIRHFEKLKAETLIAVRERARAGRLPSSPGGFDLWALEMDERIAAIDWALTMARGLSSNAVIAKGES